MDRHSPLLNPEQMRNKVSWAPTRQRSTIHAACRYIYIYIHTVFWSSAHTSHTSAGSQVWTQKIMKVLTSQTHPFLPRWFFRHRIVLLSRPSQGVIFWRRLVRAKSREKPGCDSTLTNCINGTHLWGGIKEAAKSIVHLKEFPENNSTWSLGW